jgi:hypothetical protein
LWKLVCAGLYKLEKIGTNSFQSSVLIFLLLAENLLAIFAVGMHAPYSNIVYVCNFFQYNARDFMVVLTAFGFGLSAFRSLFGLEKETSYMSFTLTLLIVAEEQLLS